jgi:hypothetical protein
MAVTQENDGWTDAKTYNIDQRVKLGSVTTLYFRSPIYTSCEYAVAPVKKDSPDHADHGTMELADKSEIYRQN